METELHKMLTDIRHEVAIVATTVARVEAQTAAIQGAQMDLKASQHELSDRVRKVESADKVSPIWVQKIEDRGVETERRVGKIESRLWFFAGGTALLAWVASRFRDLAALFGLSSNP